VNVPLAPDFPGLAGHRHVRVDSALEKLHNVEGRPNDLAVFAQHENLRDRYARLWGCRRARIVFVDGGEHGVFPLDLVSSLRDQFSCRFLSEYET
jgi:hypothetical protein